ncbi:MAG: BamA/TamA family outer membrane protein [Candidatus Aminicenantes bacterium]|nr:BamA/TamA family outer membrane protein [Candidatus Aminicenantes bacterium]
MERLLKRASAFVPLAAFLLLALPARAAAPPWQDLPIGQVLLLNGRLQADPHLQPYRTLVAVRSGASYLYRHVRRSIENLYKTGVFSGIEVKVHARADGRLDVLFILQNKPVIGVLSFTDLSFVGRRELRAAIYSLRRGDLFEESKLAKAREELQNLFRSRGYFNAQISPRVSLEGDGSRCRIQFVIAAGRIARIRRLQVQVDDERLAGDIEGFFQGQSIYRPGEFARRAERTRKLLKENLYYFPEIQVQEEFLDPERSAADITVRVACGFRYHFIFQGMTPRMRLIADVWERQVFEKWAEEESRARLLNHLKNEGFLDARVTSAVTTRGKNKTIVFTVEKNHRYRLGKITVHGNRSVSDEKIREIIKSDDLLFHKLGWLRINSLVADMEVLKLFYYYQGISPIGIRLEPTFHDHRADIDFHISEGAQYRMENVEFRGNRAFSSQELYRLIASRNGAPYVPKRLGEDIDRLQNFYWDNGFDEATVSYELSPGESKSLLITIDERQRKQMGEMIIVGASAAQRRLLRRLFPLDGGQPFRRNQVEAFRSEIESSAIFSEIRLEKIPRDDEIIDLLVKVIPDRSRFYGFGVGWEERRGPRGTLEYQEKNLFNSVSSLAATLQLGVNERRGILAVDTPFFLKSHLTSSFKAWEENETYPSYSLIRWGLGVSLVKKFSDSLYLLGTARWYRTTLTDLAIPVFGVDQLDRPFNTTALSLSFVNENRDNPFNPQKGHFLTADLKLGLPFFEKDYTFLKLFWNYQKHVPFLRDGAFSFSIKNGFGFGDMSITERFFAGGSHSFRGARNDRLGPINLDSPDEGGLKGKPEGGNILLLFNLEATVPSLLVPMKDLFYTFFADVGNVFAKSSDFNLRKMERALGFGLKYRTPLGPIRLDFAFNLRRAAEQNFLVFIGIGNVY